MRHFWFIFTSLLWSFTFALDTADVKGYIEWNAHCANISDLGISSKAILDGGVYQGSVNRQGHFTIPQVPAGTYILSLVTHSHLFDSYQINVEPPHVHVRTYTPGTPMIAPSAFGTVPTLRYPIAMVPKANYRASKAYFVPREGFNLLGMFQNPMMVMMVFAGIMVLATPYLMKNLENMDPESAEELKEQQMKIANIQNALSKGDFRAGLSQLMSAADEPTSSTAVSSKQSGQTKARKGGKGKK